MKKINHLLPKALFLIFILSQSNCTVDIEGAPCNPQLDNCPSGQYCSEEGVCRMGVKSIKDVMPDVSSEDRAEVRDIKEDIYLSDTAADEQTKDTDTEEDIIVSEDADVFYYDVSPDVTDISDAGCSNKCNKGEKVCISQYAINECVFNNDTGCYEWSGEKFCNTPPENKCNGNTAIVYNPDG
ncbi:MAG: hypothetical protein N3B13_10685, partial [Deltaproteobacteria bacterium]|nr:hypothetical protein [Deltaproteobacteria bacterium]